MKRAAVQTVFLATGFCAVLWSLPSFLSASDIGVILGVIAGAEMFAYLFLQGKTANSTLENLVACWIALCVAVSFAVFLEGIAVFKGQPIAALCLLGMTLPLSLMRFYTLSCAISVFAQVVYSARLIVFALGFWILNQLAPASVELIVAFSVFLVAMMLAAVLWGRDKAAESQATQGISNQGMLSWLKYADVLVAASLFPPTIFFPYLVAKGISMILVAFLRGFEISTQPQLSAAVAAQDQARFAAITARINLGILLMIGGLAVGLLGILPLISLFPIIDLQTVHSIALWLLLAESVPALCGATTLILRNIGFKIYDRSLTILGCLVFLSLSFALPTENSVQVAKTYATVQICIGFAGAVVLAVKAGVWPGVTAVLFRQIRLF